MLYYRELLVGLGPPWQAPSPDAPPAPILDLPYDRLVYPFFLGVPVPFVSRSL